MNEVKLVVCNGRTFVTEPEWTRVRPSLRQKSIINPRRACAARVTAVVLCVCLCVCLSVTLIPANRALRHPTKGSSGFS